MWVAHLLLRQVPQIVAILMSWALAGRVVMQRVHVSAGRTVLLGA